MKVSQVGIDATCLHESIYGDLAHPGDEQAVRQHGLRMPGEISGVRQHGVEDIRLDRTYGVDQSPGTFYTNIWYI